MPPAVFSMVPVEVWGDKRLTLEQLRVLGSLLSFCGPDRQCFPSRQEISRRSGVHVANVSAATTVLEQLGWLTKVGKGGFSKANRYFIHVPETLAQQATVADSATVAEPARGMRVAEQATVAQQATVAESASSTVAQQARGKEQTSEQTNTPLPPSKAKRKNAQTLQAFLDACKAQEVKPINSDDPIFDYAEKVGISEEMLSVAWSEFKARNLPGETTQKDWRAHYRNAVKRNWFRLWFVQAGEEARWTTAGEQARRAAA